MMQKKQEIITFKVDPSIASQLKGISNRSEFIRNAILSAMQNVCPFCMGTGILQPDQRKHWEQFLETHTLERCEDCNAIQIICPSTSEDTP